MVGAELTPDFETVVGDAGQDHRHGAERLGDRDAEQADRPGADHRHALAGDQSAQFGQPVHRGAGGDDQRPFLVGHLVGEPTSVLMWLTAYSAEPAVGGEAVGAVALVDARRSSGRN